MASIIPRPNSDEYAPYFEKYTSLIKSDLDLGFLGSQIDTLTSLIGELSEEDALFKYAEDKWTIKECLGHMIETERVFLYRALRMSRADGIALPGFDQDQFVETAQHNSTKYSGLLSEFESVRISSIAFIRNLPDNLLSNIGQASGHPLSCRATLHMMAGHIEHHLNIFKNVYLPKLNESK